jgi:hypothetical protein
MFCNAKLDFYLVDVELVVEQVEAMGMELAVARDLAMKRREERGLLLPV